MAGEVEIHLSILSLPMGLTGPGAGKALLTQDT